MQNGWNQIEIVIYSLGVVLFQLVLQVEKLGMQSVQDIR